MSKESKESKTINDNLLGERYVKFGVKYIHVPSLLKGYLALRTENCKYIKNRPSKSISPEMKNIFLDIIFKNKFDEAADANLSETEQKLFDDTCSYSRMSMHCIARRISITEKEKTELIGKFNVLKGELLAGNTNPEVIKKMRNILLELKAKKMIPKPHYDELMSEIVACI